VARYGNLRPVPTGTVFLGGTAIDDFTARIGDLAGVAQNAMTALAIAGTAGEPFGISLQTTGAADRFFVSPAGGFDGVREKLRILANLINADPTLEWTAEVWGYHLALKKNTAGTINDIAAASLTGAPAALANALVANTRQYALGTTGASPFQAAGAAGSDGTAPGFAEYLGDEAAQTGLHALDGVDLFNLMILPGDRDVAAATQLQLWGPAGIYCRERRALLLIDAPDNFTGNGRPVAQASDVNALRSLVVKDYSAVFYPKVQFSDGGVLKLIGPSGLIADLRGITDLDVNCLRKFPAGFLNWGARTMDGSDDIGSEWKYIPIRRLALFLEESLFRGTKWVVFEPNDEPLWAKIRLNLNAFMMGLFRQEPTNWIGWPRCAPPSRSTHARTRAIRALRGSGRSVPGQTGCARAGQSGPDAGPGARGRSGADANAARRREHLGCSRPRFHRRFAARAQLAGRNRG
jgi:hypothetical protein